MTAGAPVAQWTERGRPKACVGGSSPSGGATPRSGLVLVRQRTTNLRLIGICKRPRVARESVARPMATGFEPGPDRAVFAQSTPNSRSIPGESGACVDPGMAPHAFALIPRTKGVDVGCGNVRGPLSCLSLHVLPRLRAPSAADIRQARRSGRCLRVNRTLCAAPDRIPAKL